MDFNSYIPQALRTCKFFDHPILDRRHGLLGLITEVGEFTDDVKRMAIYGAEFTIAVQVHLSEEAGDIQWYIPVILHSQGRDSLFTFTDAPVMIEQLGLNFGDGDLPAISIALAGLAGMLMVDERLRPVCADDVTVLSSIVYILDNMVAPMLCTSGGAIRERNIAKLKLRYPDRYSDAAAMARADKPEERQMGQMGAIEAGRPAPDYSCAGRTPESKPAAGC